MVSYRTQVKKGWGSMRHKQDFKCSFAYNFDFFKQYKCFTYLKLNQQGEGGKVNPKNEHK